MMKILIISDSHGDSKWLDFFDFNDYDGVIHAGDHLMSSKQINEITPFYVDGNNDWGRQHLLEFELEGIKFVLTHGDEYIRYFNYKDLWYDHLLNLAQHKKANILIFGHTHIPVTECVDNVTIINPGSVSYSRHNGKKCYCELQISNGQILNIKQCQI